MRWMFVIASLGIVLAAPASALGAGGPVGSVQGGSGISLPGGPFRYVATSTGRDTAIRRIGPGGTSAIRVRGQYGIPAVDPSGTLTGLSADGRTLVLAELPGATYPPRTTRLLVLNAPLMTVRAAITLPGWSNVDAISQDGRWLYLIHYPPSGDISRYAVLAYNLVTRRMRAKPIVDPHDRSEAMTGFPVTRVMSADGRWAYTLYIRPSGAPFIHALDTAGVRAVCVDLPSSLEKIDIGNGQLSLGPGGKTIRIDADGAMQAVVDTRTFAVRLVHSAPVITERSVATPTPVARRASTRDSGSLLWELLLAAATLAIVGGAIQLRARLRAD